MNSKELFYQFTKEILEDNNGVEIDYDDDQLKITFKLTKEDQDKLNNALIADNLDPQSLVKAPSTGKFYCEALSKPNSQNYYDIEKIAHIPDNESDTILKNFISADKDNNLILDSKGLLKVSNSNCRKILTEKDGSFANNTWTFYWSIKEKITYDFVIDGTKILQYVRPLQISIFSVPFKMPSLNQTFQVISSAGEVVGWVNIILDSRDGILLIKSNVLTAQDEIQIYER